MPEFLTPTDIPIREQTCHFANLDEWKAAGIVSRRTWTWDDDTPQQLPEAQLSEKSISMQQLLHQASHSPHPCRAAQKHPSEIITHVLRLRPHHHPLSPSPLLEAKS